MPREAPSPTPPTSPSAVRPSRSVLDYDTEDALRKALLAVELTNNGDQQSSDHTHHHHHQSHKRTSSTSAPPPASPVLSPRGSGEATSALSAFTYDYHGTSDAGCDDDEMGDDVPPSSMNLDWVLNDYDPETTEAQSMKEELKRLQVLKSYLVLDAEREEAFERITSVASRVYQVPIALVSLLDLGRQWFMSNRGLDDVRETPRKMAFCAHAILSRHNKLVVPDATKDFRFKDNPLVVGPPDIRFYAGIPLVSPEGYKLGTLCIIDRKPWPNGLTDDQEATLRDLAQMTVDALVQRRHRLQTQENPAHLIAYTAHDLMQPLTGVQLSLSLLKDDDEFKHKIDSQQQELLATASTCADLMVRICETAIDSLRKSSDAPHTDSTTTSAAYNTNDDVFPSSTLSSSRDRDALPITKMDELVRSLHMIVEPIPKQVPLIIQLDPNVPSIIWCDDLKLFRSALNLLSSAASRCKHGCIVFRIYPTHDGNELVFECSDTADNIPVEEYQYLYQQCRPGDGNLRLCLSSVASLISSLDGSYGFRPKSTLSSSSSVGGGVDGMTMSTASAKKSRSTGSLFWFSVPLLSPDQFASSSNNSPSMACNIPTDMDLLLLSRKNRRERSIRPCVRKEPIIPTVVMKRIASGNAVASARNVPLIVHDRRQADVVQNSCFGNIFNTRIRCTNDDEIPSSSMMSGLPPQKLSMPVGQPASEDEHLHARHHHHCPPPHAIASSSNSTPTHHRNTATTTTSTTSCTVASGGRRSQRVRRALVVDDSLVVRKSLAMALKRLGYEASQAENGLEGLEKLTETMYDLVLCDFLMPVMDGFDCVKQYRLWEAEHRPSFRQLIIGISAHANNSIAAQGLDAGMDDFRPKPIGIKILTELNQSEAVQKSSSRLEELECCNSLQHGDSMYDSSDESESVRKRAASSSNATAAMKHEMDHQDFSSSPRHRPFAKRQCLDSGSSHSINPMEYGTPSNREYICLIATDRPTRTSSDVLRQMENYGWKVVVVHDGADALRLLQMRNWDAVLIDDDLPILDGTSCMNQFRTWEHDNRVNRQKNTFYVSDMDIPSPMDAASIVQPPSGYDYVLHKPVVWKDLKHLLDRSCQDASMAIVIKKAK